jgi:hypothetical protein
MESDHLGRRLLRNSDPESDCDGFANGHRATDAFADGHSYRYPNGHRATDAFADGHSDRFADRHRATDAKPNRDCFAHDYAVRLEHNVCERDRDHDQ